MCRPFLECCVPAGRKFRVLLPGLVSHLISHLSPGLGCCVRLLSLVLFPILSSSHQSGNEHKSPNFMCDICNCFRVYRGVIVHLHLASGNKQTLDSAKRSLHSCINSNPTRSPLDINQSSQSPEPSIWKIFLGDRQNVKFKISAWWTSKSYIIHPTWIFVTNLEYLSCPFVLLFGFLNSHQNILSDQNIYIYVYRIHPIQIENTTGYGMGQNDWPRLNP